MTSSPAIGADGAIYVHTDNGYLYGYFPDGTMKWRAVVPGESYSSPSIGDDGTIYIGSDDENLYALSPLDGAVKWKFKANGEIYSSPAIDDLGYLYFGTLSGKFYSITSSGALRWAYDVGSAVSSSPALAVNRTVYFGAYDGYLYALSSAGALQWKYATADEIRGSSPAVTSDGSVLIGSYDRDLHVVSANGIRRHRYSTGAYIRSSPMIDDRTLFFGSGDSRLYVDTLNLQLANSPWPMHRQNPRRTGRRAGTTAPLLVNSPTTRAVSAGTPATLAVNAIGADPLSFQWYRNGLPITGATRSTYTIDSPASVHTGSYTVEISNTLGTVATIPALVALQNLQQGCGRRRRSWERYRPP